MISAMVISCEAVSRTCSSPRLRSWQARPSVALLQRERSPGAHANGLLNGRATGFVGRFLKQLHLIRRPDLEHLWSELHADCVRLAEIAIDDEAQIRRRPP